MAAAELPHVDIEEVTKATRIAEPASLECTHEMCIGVSGIIYITVMVALIGATCIFGFLGFTTAPFVWNNFYLIGVVGVMATLFAITTALVSTLDNPNKCLLGLPAAWIASIVNAIIVHFMGYLVELLSGRMPTQLDPWTYSAGTLVLLVTVCIISIIVCSCAIRCC